MTEQPRWMKQRFGSWLPEERQNSWNVVLHRMMKEPVYFFDFNDIREGYVMDENNAMNKARWLNAIAFSPPENVLVVWEHEVPEGKL